MRTNGLDANSPGIRSRTRTRFLTGGITALATIGQITAPAKAAQFEFKCGTIDTAASPRTARLTQMWAAIERESGGRIHTQLFSGSSLGSEDAMLSQLRLGALHFQSISPAALATTIPAWNIPFLGFAFKDVSEAFRVLSGPLGAYCRQETANKGLYVTPGIWQTGMGHVCTTTHPIRVPDDMRGFRIRTAATKISLDFFKTLGASPTTVSFAEVYPALQTKLVEGVQAAVTVIESTKWYEVLKYLSLTSHIWYATWVVGNGDSWKALPPDLQAVVERNTQQFSLLDAKDVADGEAAVQRKLTTDRGMMLNLVDQAPFQARLGPYYKTWSAEFGPTAWGILQSSLSRKLL